MRVYVHVLSYEIDKQKMDCNAEIKIRCQIRKAGAGKFLPAEELRAIDKVLHTLNREGIEIADSNSNVEVNINELAKNVEKEMRRLKPMSRIW